MLKYLNTDIVFQEIPDETTLAINITGCKIGCKGCHSAYLADDIGTKLDVDTVVDLILANKGITCVAFMGGDSEPESVNAIAKGLQQEKYWTPYLKDIKIAWYSGMGDVSTSIDVHNFDYIKIGPYIEELGPLNKETTNQRLYEIVLTRDVDENYNPVYGLEDTTYKFWKDKRL